VSKHYVRRADVTAVRAAIEDRRRFRRTWRAELRGAVADLRRMVLSIGGVKR